MYSMNPPVAISNAFDIATGGFIEYIQKYKDHNAILLWELGNEYNYHPEWFGGDINIWYKTLDIAAGLIQMIDESRPVSTAHGELPQDDVLAYGKNIDIWGVNVYRWDKLIPSINIHTPDINILAIS